MANLVDVTKINEGPRNAVFSVFIQADGSGELSNYPIVNPATDLAPALRNAPVFSIQEIVYDLNDFQIIISFASNGPVTPVWTLSPGNSTEVCFEEWGGLWDQSAAPDGLGTLQISTRGLLNAGQTGSFLVALKKSNMAQS